MTRKVRFAPSLLCGAALGVTVPPALGQPVAADIVVVTAQKREQAIQDVPIAVSAFTESQLRDRGLIGGYSLLEAIPNVTFSKDNFTNYNFQIRGVGYKNVSAGSDTGVGIHVNGAPLTSNRLFEADFYDVQRVEVLRGPQGTLFGRNATGGVVNVLTRRPSDELEGSIRAEAANYDAYRLTGVINLPLESEVFDLRLAATTLQRDGFMRDTYRNEAIDGRDAWAARATVSFEPAARVSGWFLYEHFDEDDDRSRVGKQLCATDDGPANVGGVPLVNPVARGFFSQGCRPASLYDPAALGAVNALATLGGSWNAVLDDVTGIPGLATIAGNPNAGIRQDPNLRHVQSAFEPVYRAKQDLAMLSIEVEPSTSLTVTSLTSWNEDTYYTFADYNRTVPLTPFLFVPGVTAADGTFCDPQLACHDRIASADIASQESRQWTQELRVQSELTGKLNFNAGATYVDYDVAPGDYYIFSNALTITTLVLGGGTTFIDLHNPPDGSGQNYYLNRTQRYRLKAWAAMGEVYYEPFDGFEVTLGLRYTDDHKDVFPVQPLLFGFLSGVTSPLPTPHQQAEFRETTGRVGFDWRINSGRTLLYAVYSRGYKGGGFNPPSSVNIQGVQPTFAPEFVNALEAGVKNTLADGRLLLDVTGFRYAYQGYQISKIVQRTAVNENVDAVVNGLEAELAWEPLDRLRFDGGLGWLDTRITGGSSLDPFDRIQGDPSLTLIHDPFAGNNCTIPTAVLLQPVAGTPFPDAVSLFDSIPAAMGGICTGANGYSAFASEGHAVALAGKELPNAPKLTFNLGLQYTWALRRGWDLTARGDYYRQGDSFMRMFNTAADKLEGYENLNLLLRAAEPQKGLSVELFFRNATGEVAITDSYLADDSGGLFRNIFLTEPRTFGLRVSKEF